MKFALLTMTWLLFMGPAPAHADTLKKASFYFSAHEDDWQLFMNPPAYNDVADHSAKTIFVHITAGDAGDGNGKAEQKFPYFLAREKGALAGIRFMADVGGEHGSEGSRHILLNNHRLLRVNYKNTVSYFLRLPDGNPDGSGYVRTGFESLQRLAEGKVQTLKAVDGTAHYSGWSDLVATLRAVIDLERADAADVQFNFAELDSSVNPGDHSDHLTTAKAVIEATKDLRCANRYHYIDYATSTMAENMSLEEKQMESAVFAISAATLVSLGQFNPWDQDHRSWLGRNYSRLERGTGRCERARLTLFVKE